VTVDDDLGRSRQLGPAPQPPDPELVTLVVVGVEFELCHRRPT
jgi:hypothetical protein